MHTPSLAIDLVQLCLLVCTLASACCLWLARTQRDGPRYIVLWAISGAALSIGILLVVLRTILPDVVSILLANLLLTVGYAYLAGGARAFYGAGMVGIMPLTAACFGVFVTAYLTGSGLAERAAIMSATMLAFTLITLQVFVALARRSRSFGIWLATITLALNSVFLFFRMCLYLGVDHGLLVPQDLDRYLIGAGVVVSLGMAVGLVMLSARHLVLPRLALRLATPVVPAGGPSEAMTRLEPAAGPPPQADRASGWFLHRGDMALHLPNGAVLRLTGNEWLVAQRLLGAGDHAPVSRSSLNSLIGRPADNPKDRAIDILISRLRRKCADAGADLPVTAVRGQGYLFNGVMLDAFDGTAAK